MKNKHTYDASKTTAVDLRRRAEEIAMKKSAYMPEDLETLPSEQTRQTLHELRVHQIELEMQNEELRRAHVELEVSQTRYCDLYEMAPVGYVTLSEQGLILEANLTSATMLGVARGALVKRPITRFIIKDDQDIYYQYLKQLLDTGALQACDMRMMRSDGTQFWARFEATVAQDADGASVYRAVMSDITERKRMEKTLREKEAEVALSKERNKAQQYLDIAEVMIVSLNNQGEITMINKKGCTLLGYEEEELIGKHWFDNLLPAACREDARRVFQELITGEGDLATYHENPVVTRSGDERVIAWQNSILRDDEGSITGILSSGMDITERIAARKENEMLQKQIQQAQKMEAIGTLAGGIAHDFNNILAAIFGYLEIALSQVEKNSQLEGYLHEVLIASKRAKDLVQQILAFSRQSEQELMPVQVKLIAKEALKLLKATLPSTIEIRQALESDLLVMADPTQLHQIFMNLCTNAAHAMGKKGGILSVKLESEELKSEFAALHPDMKPGRYIKLSVSDTGHGMSSEVMDCIFNPFFTTKKQGEGTGMGLSVVHGIVKSYDGIITAYSKPGKGAIFDVFFPAIDSMAGQEKAKGKPVPTGTERILFVDDEPDVTNTNKVLLESLGYKVMSSTSSTNALNLFKTQPDMFDLVITDMTMPDITGDILARECMAIRPDIPVILCTGFSSRITEKKAKIIGIKAFIMKPILRSELAETIREVLDGR